MDRWATFDCYGTLIDWNGGIGRELERVFGAEAAPRLLHCYHELEPQVQREDPARSYRDVLNVTLARTAEQQGLVLPAEESDALARSLPTWPPFAEVPAALTALRERGWKLALLSNTDRDFIDASAERIGVPFETAIVASEIGSYKPAPAHWRVFFDSSGAERARHVHVGASLFHDVAPALELGLRVVWINRLGEDAEPQPTRELHDLAALPDALDELVGA
jgi:2-haloacid dehalogenase